jgi:hypothetical protein
MNTISIVLATIGYFLAGVVSVGLTRRFTSWLSGEDIITCVFWWPCLCIAGMVYLISRPLVYLYCLISGEEQ